MTASVRNASFYADFAELNTLKSEAKAQTPEALRSAAQQFESLFTQMMLKSMRAASFGDSLTGSDEVDFYQGMFDQQIASELSKGKGLGLAEMLVEQLTRSGLVQQNSAQDVNTVGRVSTRLPDDVGLKPDLQSESSWPPATREDFVRELWPHAQQAADELGVAPSTLIAHAALETGWGRSMPCNADGSPSFNLFGIKATSNWNGASTESHTLEFENGAAVGRVERFKSYASPAECFDDYAALLGGTARYAGARGSGDDVQRFAQGLKQGGYATDPDYANKLSGVADSLDRLLSASATVSSNAAIGRNSDGDIS